VSGTHEHVAAIHDRMPVILESAQFARWLDSAASIAELDDLLVPYPAARTTSHPVSTRVNRPQVDDVACLTPAAPLLPQPRLF
jgi:putative SOS response-associated peptidase YedK